MNTGAYKTLRRQDVTLEEKDQALRDDVRALGAMVGELIREQAGEELFEMVENARLRSIRRREGNEKPGEELVSLVGDLDPDTATQVVRSFATYFQMVNTAEKVHRIRRRRDYLRGPEHYQPGGFEDSLLKLKAAGLTIDELGKRLAAEPEERFVGFGERSNTVDQRGWDLEHYVGDGPYYDDDEYMLMRQVLPPAGTRWRADSTYFPIPWLLSSRGYGVLIDNDELSYHRLASEDEDALAMEVESSELEFRVFGGPTPAEAVELYGMGGMGINAWVMSVNLDGVFLGTKYAIEAMKKNGSGSIINMSSIEGMVGDSRMVAYDSSKGGLRTLTKSAALHCAKRGYNIRINTVHPGFIDTDMVRGFLKSQAKNGDVSAARRALESLHPVGHLGEPDDVAYAVLYLASDESKFATGSELVIDGGYTAQ